MTDALPILFCIVPLALTLAAVICALCRVVEEIGTWVDD